ncbi:MAG TPA: peptide MFS transporter, partial [Steroidobacteraceae bacterium]|nr:peptide MFS transporter [Steroidobacteraceae bacterium]
PLNKGRVAEGTFLGEPRALAYLAFTEAWERFSYYGMTALMVLYLTQSLLLPGHVEHIQGFRGFRAALESVYGPLNSEALASQIYGLYTGFVYFTPVLGGWIADRWTGPRNAVALGAILMSAGHIAMAFDASFLLALLLLVVGCGFLKGNISAQVGNLYREDDGAGRTRGFAIFSFGINVGAVAGPLLCGLLAQKYGWHVGFGLAGLLMLIGLFTYLAGYSKYTVSIRAAPRPIQPTPLTRRQYKVIAALILVMALTVFQSIAYYQNSDMGMIWIDRYVDLNAWGFHVPVAWFNSIDPFASMLAVPLLLAHWRSQAARGREPAEIGKIVIGAWMACVANLLLVAGCAFMHPVPAVVPVLYDTLLGVAFLYYWPTLLALVSREAPPRVRATLMGTAFLSLALADVLVGQLGAFYGRMSPLQFWALEAGVAAVGAVLAMLLARPLARLFAANLEQAAA